MMSLGRTFKLFLSLDSFFLTKRLIRYSENCEKLKKLLDYAEFYGIKVRVKIPTSWSGAWEADWWKRIVFVDFYAIMSPRSRGMAFVSFAHELGHIISMDCRKDTSCFIKMREDKRWEKRKIGCFLEEWLAWTEGLVILKALGFVVDETEYWQRALRMVPMHIPCPLWREKKCQKYELIRAMKENIKAKIKRER